MTDEQILSRIPPSTTDYLRDIHGELVEIRKLQERIADALERIAEPRNPLTTKVRDMSREERQRLGLPVEGDPDD